MRIRPYRPTTLLPLNSARVVPLRTTFWSRLWPTLLAIAAGLAGGALFLAFLMLLYFLIAWR